MKYALILIVGFLIGKVTNPAQAVDPFFTKDDIWQIMGAGYQMGYEDAVYLQDDLSLVRLTEKDIEEKLN
jgi:hypothetical protein